jgi:hypothetical protein
VLAYGRLRQRQALGDVGAAAILRAFGENAQDRQAHRVSQRTHRIGEIFVLHLLHRKLPIEEAWHQSKPGLSRPDRA